MLLITRCTAALALCLAANLCLAQAVIPPASSVRLLVPGASVSLTAQVMDGKPTISRISAGRNGFSLPY